MENDIEVGLIETGRGLDRVHWRAVMNTAVKFQIP
jgi:hypothetical protein